jgi:hypothetical protein
MALRTFQMQQRMAPHSFGEFWDNQTAQAAVRVFAEAHREGNSIFWFLAHGVDYGVSLELANDRKHESLRPIVQGYLGRFMEDVRKL